MSEKGKKHRNSSDHDYDSIKKTSCVNYDAIVDRQVGDKRFERERRHKLSVQDNETQPAAAMSSTFDAFQRMAAGLEGRTIADKIAGQWYCVLLLLFIRRLDCI